MRGHDWHDPDENDVINKFEACCKESKKTVVMLPHCLVISHAKTLMLSRAKKTKQNKCH